MLKKVTQFRYHKAWGIFVLRAVTGLVFVNHGWMKLSSLPGTESFFHTLGLPPGAATFIALVEVIGGLMLIFGIASLAVVGLIIGYHARAGRSLYLSIALGLLLGGALGNLLDRLRLGYVVDFVDIGLGGIRFSTFNIADAAISTAILMLIGAALFPALIGWREKRSDG